jgi:hypothetical protein
MSDEERLIEKRTLYAHLAHAMQSGVAYDIGSWKPSPGNSEHNTSSKFLKVAVNSALCDHGALVTLLISKGVFTEEEYFDAAIFQLVEEVKTYERTLSKRMNTDITLA